jgi:hypothetical protein
MREYGQASLDIDVAGGRTVDVYYAPPWHQFARGRIGLARQRRPGTGCLVAMLAIVVIVVIAIVAAIALSS